MMPRRSKVCVMPGVEGWIVLQEVEVRNEAHKTMLLKAVSTRVNAKLVWGDLGFHLALYGIPATQP